MLLICCKSKAKGPKYLFWHNNMIRFVFSSYSVAPLFALIENVACFLVSARTP